MNSSTHPVSPTLQKIQKNLKRRYRFEKIFKAFGMASIGVALFALVILLGDSLYKGHKAFYQYQIKLSIDLRADNLNLDSVADVNIEEIGYRQLVRQSFADIFPEASGFSKKRSLYKLLSSGAEYTLMDYVKAHPEAVGQVIDLWVAADDEVDTYLKHFSESSEKYGPISEQQEIWIKELKKKNLLKAVFNSTFFQAGDSREPEQAGIYSALSGTFFTLLVTLLLSFPLGVAAAIYLEEFAPQNKWTDLIEVNVNNLAAVPSIIFGLLGLAVFINLFGTPRSVPFTGGLVLTLMTLPTIIIAGRAAIKSVPPSIREAALGIGASKMQTVVHHVLPLALPGMLTGTIIGMARALGETAPLLMIGMVAFIVDVPHSALDPATVLPVQIYLWSDSPERAFMEKTSAAILVLLVFLVCMNALAIYLRRRLEKRW
jgi:phosphate transport system permease protein